MRLLLCSLPRYRVRSRRATAERIVACQGVRRERPAVRPRDPVPEDPQGRGRGADRARQAARLARAGRQPDSVLAERALPRSRDPRSKVGTPRPSAQVLQTARGGPGRGAARPGRREGPGQSLPGPLPRSPLDLLPGHRSWAMAYSPSSWNSSASAASPRDRAQAGWLTRAAIRADKPGTSPCSRSSSH